MAPPVALITGASSGIGLALTKHLLERGWSIIMADVNPPKDTLPADQILFIKTDVSSWDQQAMLFSQAYAWHNRLDFCALNAGIDDRDDIFNSISPTSPPKKPNMKTIDVNFTAVYYGMKLAAHYLSLDSSGAGKLKPGGKLVVTASAAGIYPHTATTIPQYAASKCALVGLVRALAPTAAKVNIRVNAICPALVATNLAPPGLLESFTEAHFTPMSTIIRGFSELAVLENVNDRNWVEGGANGEAVEGNHDQLIYHRPVGGDTTSDYLNDAGQEAWANAYIERNKRFANGT